MQDGLENYNLIYNMKKGLDFGYEELVLERTVKRLISSFTEAIIDSLIPYWTDALYSDIPFRCRSAIPRASILNCKYFPLNNNMRLHF